MKITFKSEHGRQKPQAFSQQFWWQIVLSTFSTGGPALTNSDFTPTPQGVVYERADPKTGEPYIGQAKSPERFDARQDEHDKKLGTQHNYKILGFASPGTKLDVLEEDMIRTKGGLQKEGGTLANKRHQMSEKRYRANGGKK